jgi:TATA-binding protein-associated factor Taf7
VFCSRLIQNGERMCERCNEIEKKISHYRRFLNQRFDPLTEQRITEAIKELEERKAALH